MTQDEIRHLIQNAITEPGGTWADFGCGTGNFTQALRELLGEEAIYAIDRDQRALNRLESRLPSPNLKTINTDFTQQLELPPLDGLLIANALHFVRRQEKTLQLLKSYLRPGGKFVIVEYDVKMPRGYIPHPVPYSRFAILARNIGLENVQKVGSRKSPSSGITMYTASGIKM